MRPASAKGVDLRVEMPEALLVEADPGMLRHVLVNLLFHGAVHAGGAGEVVVRAAPCEADEGAVRVRVQSSGPVLEAEARARVFEPFFATRAGGSGLGLAVVKRLVEEQHGRVVLDSDAGEGVSFSLWLLRGGAPSPGATRGGGSAPSERSA